MSNHDKLKNVVSAIDGLCKAMDSGQNMSLAEIATAAGVTENQAAKFLTTMTQSGLVFRIRDGGRVAYTRQKPLVEEETESMSNLTAAEKNVIEHVLTEEGVPPEKVMRIVRRISVQMPARSVSVSQGVGAVAERSAVVGYSARSIG